MTVIWEEFRWVIWLAVIIFIVILLDELAYTGWKRANPGAIYSHLSDKHEIPIIDPSAPPTTIIYE